MRQPSETWAIGGTFSHLLLLTRTKDQGKTTSIARKTPGNSTTASLSRNIAESLSMKCLLSECLCSWLFASETDLRANHLENSGPSFKRPLYSFSCGPQARVTCSPYRLIPLPARLWIFSIKPLSAAPPSRPLLCNRKCIK